MEPLQQDAPAEENRPKRFRITSNRTIAAFIGITLLLAVIIAIVGLSQPGIIFSLTGPTVPSPADGSVTNGTIKDGHTWYFTIAIFSAFAMSWTTILFKLYRTMLVTKSTCTT